MTLSHSRTLQLGLLQEAETGPPGMHPRQDNIPRPLQERSTASLALALPHSTASLIVLQVPAPGSTASAQKTTFHATSEAGQRKDQSRGIRRSVLLGLSPKPCRDGAETEGGRVLTQNHSITPKDLVVISSLPWDLCLT